jgi:hypothetical protein
MKKMKIGKVKINNCYQLPLGLRIMEQKEFLMLPSTNRRWRSGKLMVFKEYKVCSRMCPNCCQIKILLYKRYLLSKSCVMKK